MVRTSRYCCVVRSGTAAVGGGGNGTRLFSTELPARRVPVGPHRFDDGRARSSAQEGPGRGPRESTRDARADGAAGAAGDAEPGPEPPSPHDRRARACQRQPVREPLEPALPARCASQLHLYEFWRDASATPTLTRRRFGQRARRRSRRRRIRRSVLERLPLAAAYTRHICSAPISHGPSLARQ